MLRLVKTNYVVMKLLQRGHRSETEVNKLTIFTTQTEKVLYMVLFCKTSNIFTQFAIGHYYIVLSSSNVSYS
jgi:hypothetical protein